MKKTITQKTAEIVRNLTLAAAFLGIVPPGLAQIETTWGNDYLLGNGGTATVNPTTAQWVTFTAGAADTINGVRLYQNATPIGSPALEVGLYAVDGNGKPTGSALVSTNLTPTNTGAAWVTALLGNYTLTANTTYALRVSTATAGASFAWRYTTENPANNMQPVGLADTHWRRGNGVNNPATNGQNVWVLTTTNGTAIGQPYINSSTQNLASTNITIAQRFVFNQAGAGTNDVLQAVSAYLSVAATPPVNPVTLKIIGSDGAVLSTATLDLSSAPSGAAIYQFDLATPISLTNSTAYYIGMYSSGSAGNSVLWYGWNTTDDALYRSASFQGENAYAVSFASQSDYTGTPTSTPNRDYYFDLHMVPEPSVVLLTLAGLALTFFVRHRACR